MSAQQLQAPFPYFGGKRRAASIIWDALGDPGGYVEPFAGSAAVLQLSVDADEAFPQAVTVNQLTGEVSE